MKKIIPALIGIGATAVAVVALFLLAIVGQQAEWCALPCLASRMSCDSPFEAQAVCAEINLAAYEHGAPAPHHLALEFVEGVDGRRSFHNFRGQRLAGSKQGRLLKIAHLPGDRVCDTTLRHEVRHVIIRIDGDETDDINHERPHWGRFDGCPK